MSCKPLRGKLISQGLNTLPFLLCGGFGWGDRYFILTLINSYNRTEIKKNPMIGLMLSTLARNINFNAVITVASADLMREGQGGLKAK